jgi:hypothetical protein
MVSVASIALTGVYVFVTEASYWSKTRVVGLLLLSILWRYGLFLQIALGIFLSLYFQVFPVNAVIRSEPTPQLLDAPPVDRAVGERLGEMLP